MGPTLAYDRPTYAEDGPLPAATRIGIVAVTFYGAAVVLLAVVLIAVRWLPPAAMAAALLVGIVAVVPARRRVRLMAGRLEVDTYVAHVHVGHLEVRLADVRECEWRLDESGVDLHCGGRTVFIGSADPLRLAAAVDVGRSDE